MDRGCGNLTPLSETKTVEHLLPSYYQVPIDVAAEWAASIVSTRSPFIQLGRLEQCE